MQLLTLNAPALAALGAFVLISSIANALPPRTPFGASLATTKLNPLATLVDPRNHPDWAGLFDSNDCKQAIALMKQSVVHYDARKILIFWSNKWIIRPPAENAFELPWISHSGKYSQPTPILPTSNYRNVLNIQPQVPASSSSASRKILATMFYHPTRATLTSQAFSP